MLISTNSYILSQTDTDSVKIHVETLRSINLDLARLDYFDSTIIRKDSIISNLYDLDSVRVDRINDYSIEVKELTTQKNKAVKRLKRTRKISFTLGAAILIETFILILK